MIKFLKKFRKDDSGAVTVDWVVLTAAVVAIAITGLSAIETQSSNVTTTIASKIQQADTALKADK